jgi:hypothetical protein
MKQGRHRYGEREFWWLIRKFKSSASLKSKIPCVPGFAKSAKKRKSRAEVTYVLSFAPLASFAVKPSSLRPYQLTRDFKPPASLKSAKSAKKRKSRAEVTYVLSFALLASFAVKPPRHR